MGLGRILFLRDNMSHPEEEQPHREVTMRIMCLHGFGSDSEALYENQLRDLDERLFQRHGIELVYVNSPLACDPSDIVLQQLEPNNLLLDMWVPAAPSPLCVLLQLHFKCCFLYLRVEFTLCHYFGSLIDILRFVYLRVEF